MDASRIVDHLYQGSKPAKGDMPWIREVFDALVLSANEYQPDVGGIKTIRVPLNDYSDADITDEEKKLALVAGEEVAKEMDEGKDVLVTCVAGLNRSGLISALALIHSKKHKMSPQDAVRTIRKARPQALFNKSFTSYLKQFATSASDRQRSRIG
jgi:protein-tyrosine phosphatase